MAAAKARIKREVMSGMLGVEPDLATKKTANSKPF
jgi:hypothetical protein